MSGELDDRPDLTALVRDLRDRVYELEHRISGDTNPLSLNDLEDVRVDSLGDVTITLADGSALVYRAADELWIPGTAAAASFPITFDDGTYTYEIIQAGPSGPGTEMTLRVSKNSDPTNIFVLVNLDGFPDLNMSTSYSDGTRGDFNFVANRDFSVDAGRTVGLQGGGGVNIESGTSNLHLISDTTDIVLTSADNIILDPTTGGVFVTNLPTSDPGNPGQLFLTGTALQVSP